MRRFFLLALVGCLMTALAGADLHAASGKDPNKIEGVLVRKTAASVVVRLQNRSLVTVVVNATTKIERNDVRATLAAFRIGDRVQAILGANGIATKVEATGP